MLLVASMVQAAAFAIYLPARITFIAEVVDPSQIGPAVVLSQTAQEAMRVDRPGPGRRAHRRWRGSASAACSCMSAVTSIIAGVVLLGLPPGRPVPESHRSPFAEMVDAVRYVRANRGSGWSPSRRSASS